jgi:flagellar hook assembly protein FlgD
MSVTYAQYVSTVKSKSATRLLKIEILDSNENIIDTITPKVISGDIQLSSDSGARRSANIILDNSDGAYTPSSSYLWLNTKFKIYTGYLINSEEYYISRGIFLNGEPEITSNFAETVCSLSLYDKWTYLDGTLSGTLESPYIINSGEDIEDVVTALFTAAGEVKPPIIYPTTETTPYTLIKEAGASYADILIELANMLSWVVFYDKDGYPRFQPPTNIDTAGSVWDFTTTEVNYLGGNRKYTFSDIKNNVVVIGDNINGTLVKATASDTNVSSTTRIALIGKRTKVIEDANIYNATLAQDRADYELQKAISLIENIDMQCIPIDTIEGENVITITDDSIDLTADRYLVKSVSFPLTVDGSQQMSCWKARSLT